ncbi:MAG: insulinase family protein [Flavobacteriaceae bacterium]|nr:insulinase family protein [Flavobacteriaceae bacterium]
MKKNIILIFSFVFTVVIMQAQVDRSIQPKPGPAPKINLKTPQTFELKNGLQILVVENHKLPRVSVQLMIDNAPFSEGDKAGLSALTSGVLGSGSANISKEKFDEEVDYLGASVHVHSSGASARSLSKYFPRVFELMADAALNPLFSQEEFDKNVKQTLDGIKSGEKSVANIAGQVRKAIGYGKNHPYGEITTKETIGNISLKDVKNHYATYFKPNNAYLVVVGDITLKEVQKLVKKNFKKWKKGDFNTTTFDTPTNVAKTEINFVNMPNAVQSEVTVLSNTLLKMSDPDYHAVLVANQILGGDFNSYLNMNLREAHGYTYGARSSINADKYASMFRTGASVRNMVTDSTVIETMKEIHRIRTEDVTEENLANVKAGYVGKFVLALEKPRTIANYALNIKTKNLSDDFYKTYLQKINAVSVADIKRVANKYFGEDNARIVVVGKAIDVLPNLEKLPYAINYFDIYGNPTDKPEMNKPIPDGVTLQTVLDNFVNAIGGKDKVDAVKSVLHSSQASMQGQVLDATMKYMSPNKTAALIGMGGMILNKTVFNGTSGYSEAQGQKKVLEGKDLEDAKNSSAPFEELSIVKNGELLGIENINGSDAYVVKTGEGSKVFFDVKSGFKIQASKTQKGPGGKEMTQVFEFSDYKEVNGLKFPHLMKMGMGPMTLEFKTTEIKINEGVTDADFE